MYWMGKTQPYLDFLLQGTAEYGCIQHFLEGKLNLQQETWEEKGRTRSLKEKLMQIGSRNCDTVVRYRPELKF